MENPIEMDGMPFISQPIVEPGDKKFFAKNSTVGVELYATAVQAQAKSDR